MDRENDLGACIYRKEGGRDAASGASAGAKFGLSDSTGVDSDPKVHVHTEPVFVTLFGNGVFADVMKLR